MTIVAVSQDFPVRMTALGHLVFVLAFMGITHSALIVPLWQYLPEVPRQQKMAAKTAYQEEDPKQTIIASGPLCSGDLGDWSFCLDSESTYPIYLPNISPFKSIRVLKMLRLS